MTDTLHVTFDDHDSVITFAPSIDVDDAGWRTACVSGKLIPSIGTAGTQPECTGSTVLETTARGAEALFSFFGREVTLYGEARSSQYSVEVDGQAVAFRRNETEGVLARVAGLETKEHTLRLVVSDPVPKFSFDRADIDTAIPGHHVNTTFQHLDARWSYSPTNSDWVRWDNIWPGQTTSNQSVHLTFHAGDSAALKFHGQAVYLFGVRAGDASRYDVFLDGVRHSSLDGRSRLYTVPRALMFFAAGLDPSVEHSLSITNAAAAGLAFEFALALSSDQIPALDVPSNLNSSTTLPSGGAQSSSTVTHAATPSTTDIDTGGGGHASNTPVIAGCVLGAATLILAIGLFVFVLTLRRRRGRRENFARIPSSTQTQTRTSHLFFSEDTTTAFAPSIAQSSSSGPGVSPRPFWVETAEAETLPPYTASRPGPVAKRPF